MAFDSTENRMIRHVNKKEIADDPECQKTIAALRETEKFLNDFGFLQFGRDYVFCGKITFSLQTVSTSFELTAGSVISCCESGCMADAFSLLRKFRDDMFFYLYLVVYDAEHKINPKSASLKEMKSNIERWIENNLCDLPIGTVLQEIGQSSQVKDAVKKYNLKSYFDIISKKLNNYVHGNGIAFYNRNIHVYENNNLQNLMKSLQNDMTFITTTFLFLLALCSPLSIMSMDYIDYLDCGETPPEETLYWVAPFITKFFKRNIDQIDESCLQYLRENTYMDFD